MAESAEHDRGNAPAAGPPEWPAAAALQKTDVLASSDPAQRRAVDQ